MAVGDFLRPQRSPLSVYDEQMAEMLRQQSAGIGARDIAAESALGFPVGTMTAKILGNVLAGAKTKSAINRDAEADRARSLYAQYLKTGKIDGKSVDESGNIYEMTEQPMFKEEQVQSMVPSGTNEIGVPSLGRAPEVSVAQDKVRDMTALMPSSSSVGEKSDPSWFDRTFGGEIKTDKYSSLDEIKRAGNIDAIESLEYEEARNLVNQPEYEVKEIDGDIFYYNKKDPTGGKWIKSPNTTKKGFKVISVDKARELGVVDPEKGIVGGGYYQYNEKTGDLKLTKGVADKSQTIDIDIDTGKEVASWEKLGEGFKEEGKNIYNNMSENKKELRNLYDAKNNSQMITDMILNTKLQTGKLTELKGTLIGYAEALGILPDNKLGSKLRQDLINTQSINAGFNKIVLAYIKQLGRNPTDLDLRFMIKTMPSLDKLPEANLIILKQRQKVNEANIELIEYERKFVRDYYNGNTKYNILDDGSVSKGIAIAQNPDSIYHFETAMEEKRQEIQKRLRKELEETSKRYNSIIDPLDIEEEILEEDNIITITDEDLRR